MRWLHIRRAAVESALTPEATRARYSPHGLMAKKKYTITDGKLLLTLQEDEGGWYTVTSPTDRGMITQARTIPEAFEMARDAFAGLAAARRDLRRWNRSAT